MWLPRLVTEFSFDTSDKVVDNAQKVKGLLNGHVTLVLLGPSAMAS